jgi:hypothetical protein
MAPLLVIVVTGVMVWLTASSGRAGDLGIVAGAGLPHLIGATGVFVDLRSAVRAMPDRDGALTWRRLAMHGAVAVRGGADGDWLVEPDHLAWEQRGGRTERPNQAVTPSHPPLGRRSPSDERLIRSPPSGDLKRLALRGPFQAEQRACGRSAGVNLPVRGRAFDGVLPALRSAFDRTPWRAVERAL